MEEPCLAEMADYDRVHFDSVTGASLPSKLFEEAMQRERARTHSDWDPLGLYEQGRCRTSFHPGKAVGGPQQLPRHDDRQTTTRQRQGLATNMLSGNKC